MRKIVAGFACSLDGYIEDPNGEYDWIIIDKEVDFAEQMKRYDTFFVGRKTYEMMKKSKAPAAPGIKTYVFSTTLSEVDEGTGLICDHVADEVKKIKEADGKDIAIFGGASLLASMLNLALVDEISVSVIPVLLGQGKPMVEILNSRVPLKLTNSKVYGNGTVSLTYDVIRNKNQ